MFKKTIFALIILLTLFSVSLAGSGPDMQEGKWEIITKTEMPGMPVGMPPVTHIQCLSKDDLVPQNSQPGQECKITDIETSNNTVTWTMHCSGQGGDVKGTGKITYSGNKFNGDLNVTMPQSNMEMICHISGSRIGDCN